MKRACDARWIACGLALLSLAASKVVAAEPKGRPNVILIMTDDQGYGDLGVHGNPVIKTPHLDKLAGQSVAFDRFYVCPVCAPTRACLLTGRYNYRTRVVDTFIGRAMMDPAEVTLAELLGAAGYRTGIFGKWHLGDNYPLRAMDQGFQESLVLRGGGIGQPSDPLESSSYFDPVLQHNGKQVQTKGYCSDVYTSAAIDFIEKNAHQPFFVYLPFNAPHGPFEVPESYYDLYKNENLAPSQFPAAGHPLPKLSPALKEAIARSYGMITNIDDNVGRLLGALDKLKLADNTIVIFLTDNGPPIHRYNAGMLQVKGSVHEGGIRVPCFIRWPSRLTAGRMVKPIAAHIDLTPTLLEACGVEQPSGVRLDGKSLMPLLAGDGATWPDRTLFFQWHRGDAPQLHRAFAARSQDYKLVQPLGSQDKANIERLPLKLYDMRNDPFETRDIAAEHPEIVAQLNEAYEQWFREVSAERGYDPPRIVIGTESENPSRLTRQDWRGPNAGWKPENLGHWEVQIAEPGKYDVTLYFRDVSVPGTAHVSVGKSSQSHALEDGTKELKLSKFTLEAGPANVQAWLETADGKIGVYQMDIERKE